MIDELIRQVEAAVEASSHWAETGWPATFGFRNVEVANLKEAEALVRTDVCREEAVNYWRQARLTGGDAANAGRMALEALKTGRIDAAEGALYLCQYLEKPFEAQAKTWGPVYLAFRAECAS
jgi:hypothetical protein